MGELEPITPEPLHEKAYASLRHALRTGRFRPGQAVTIRGLGKELGVSATPVREALQRLIACHALKVLPNRTVIVPPLTHERCEEITQVRLRLEGLAGRQAVGRITDQAVKRLVSRKNRMDRAIKERNLSAYLQNNEEFHSTIYEAAQMPFLNQMIDLAWLQVAPWFNLLAVEGNFYENANASHELVVDRLVARDADGVEAAIRQDINQAVRHIIAFLNNGVKVAGMDVAAAMQG
ncbi:MAG: GntR family transcriptional regulator [Parvibaculaceae bacterium]